MRRAEAGNYTAADLLRCGGGAEGISTPDPLHAIDEPAARTATRIHAFPHISTAQHTDRNEATRCSLWRREAWLLANCWQVWGVERGGEGGSSAFPRVHHCEPGGPSRPNWHSMLEVPVQPPR